MVIVSVSFSAGALSGSSLTRAVVKHLSPIKVMLISQCCVSLAVLYALAVIKVKEPGKKSLLTDQGEEHPEIRQQKKLYADLSKSSWINGSSRPYRYLNKTIIFPSKHFWQTRLLCCYKILVTPLLFSA